MSDPKDKSSLNNPPGVADVDTEQSVITNSEEGEKIVNEEGVVADSEGITETLSEDAEPSTALNADTAITNNDESSSENPPVVN